MQHYALVPRHGRGRGYLCRYGRATMFCVTDGGIAAALIGWCRLVGDRPAGEAMAELKRLAAAPGVVAVSALVLDDAGVTALMFGGVPLFVDRGDGRELLPNPNGRPPVVMVLGPVAGLELDSGPLTNDPLLELERGVVAADGFTVRRFAGAAAPWIVSVAPPSTGAEPTVETPVPVSGIGNLPEPPFGPLARPGAPSEPDLPPDLRPPDVVSGGEESPGNVLISLQGRTDDLPDPRPLPLASSVAPSVPPGHEPAQVDGVRCSRDHFNDPRARFCHACGIAMHQASVIFTRDVRPPLGVLVFADGSYQQVTEDLVLGRDPDDDARVRAGQALGVTLVDPGNSISRVHAEVAAVEWDVHVVDRGSTNGTFVWAPAGQFWERLAAHQPRVLEPGAHVAFGRLLATFESSLRPA